jgi:hypothetical protein
VSGPIDRSSDPNEVSYYAPKWARDRDRVSRQFTEPQLPKAGGFDMAPTDNRDFDAERSRLSGSLGPSPVSEPPIPEPGRLRSARSRARGGGGTRAFLPWVLTVFLGALTGLVIVVVMPNNPGFVAKQQAGTETDGSDSPPSNVEQRIAVIDPAATAPVVHQLPVGPTQSAVATPGSADPAPATSLPANPTPAAVAPPTADAAPSPASVPAASLNTVPDQLERPVRSLGPDEIEILLKQGEDFVSVGDFASARLVFGRVWEANDVRGALAFAATYDPIVLARIGAKGATPDVAKAREWYVKARDLGSPDAAPQLEALASQNFAIPAQKGAAMASTGMEASNEAASRPSEGPAPAGSYWKHGGSIMRLEATGLSRKFFFYKPSDAELEAGAKAESLRFDGQISGKGYTGTAFLYSDRCGRSAFQVSGEIGNNDGRVVLSGRSPQVDSDCREIGRSDQKLVFDLMETPSK